MSKTIRFDQYAAQVRETNRTAHREFKEALHNMPTLADLANHCREEAEQNQQLTQHNH